MSVSFSLINRSAVLVAATCLVLAGCQSAIEKASVSGTVTLNGEPVKLGTISFEPTDPAAPSASAEIHDGRFSIESPVGNRRVAIMAYRQAKGLGPDGKPYQEQYLPAKYNLESDRFFEVEPDPMTNQKFDLTIPESELKAP